jgi:hypothetical protein
MILLTRRQRPHQHQVRRAERKRLSAHSSTAVDDAALQDGWLDSQATRQSREATLFSIIRMLAKATRFGEGQTGSQTPPRSRRPAGRLQLGGGPDGLPGGRLPQPHGAIAVGARQQPAVRAERHRAHARAGGQDAFLLLLGQQGCHGGEGLVGGKDTPGGDRQPPCDQRAGRSKGNALLPGQSSST